MKSNELRKHNRRSFLKLALAVSALPATFNLADAAGDKLKIGVIGSGRIGSTLGGVWVKAGHEVMFSSRTLENDQKLAASLGSNARAGTPREAAKFGDVLLMAVPYRALPDVGKELGELLRGKIVLDASNPIPSRDGEV